MREIWETDINEMAGISFDCSCGRYHSLSDIKSVIIGKGVLPEISKMALDFKDKKILLFSDSNTYEAAGKRVEEILRAEGFKGVKSFVYPCGEDILIPDERALGRLLMEVDKGCALIIAVGSGTVNDLAKYLSSRCKIPYIIVCTAPSMDGYLSDGAPMICALRKISFEASLAMGVLGDTEIMKKAPMILLQAGYGDVLGKLTALADWELAKELKGEYYCENCAKMVEEALKNVRENPRGIWEREESAILHLIRALTLTGAAMGLTGISRPASGAEHMLSHYWEMNFIKRGKYPQLHGIKVGIGTWVTSRIFELMREDIPQEIYKKCPKPEYIKELLEKTNNPVFPSQVGVERDLFYESVLNSYTVRNRYSILQLAVDKGKIKDIAQILTKEIYG